MCSAWWQLEQLQSNQISVLGLNEAGLPVCCCLTVSFWYSIRRTYLLVTHRLLTSLLKHASVFISTQNNHKLSFTYISITMQIPNGCFSPLCRHLHVSFLSQSLFVFWLCHFIYLVTWRENQSFPKQVNSNWSKCTCGVSSSQSLGKYPINKPVTTSPGTTHLYIDVYAHRHNRCRPKHMRCGGLLSIKDKICFSEIWIIFSLKIYVSFLKKQKKNKTFECCSTGRLQVAPVSCGLSIVLKQNMSLNKTTKHVVFMSTHD